MNLLAKALVTLSLCMLSGFLPCTAHMEKLSPPCNAADNFRWMEKNQQQTNNWFQYKTKQARKTIDALPWRSKLEAQLHSLTGTKSILSNIYDTADKRFYLRSTPEYPYLRLFVIPHDGSGHDGSDKVLIDPPVGMRIHFFSPSYNGQYVAYGLALNGSEFSTINVLNVSDGTQLSDTIPGARYPHIVWRSDNQSFFYKRLPPSQPDTPASKHLAGEKVYLHHIGQPYKADELVFDSAMVNGSHASDYDDIALYSSPDSDWLLASVSPAISGYSSTLFIVPARALNGPKTPWIKFTDNEKKVDTFIIAGKWLYLAKYNALSGYLITRRSLDKTAESEEKILEWSQGELTNFVTSKEALYISYHETGKQHFVRIPFNNIHQIQEVPRPFEGEVTSIFSGANKPDILFTLQSWIIPPQIFHYQPGDTSVENTHLLTEKAYDFSPYEVEKIQVASKDQVLVPLTLIHRKGIKLEGSSPTWLTAYGAYESSTFPYFSPSNLLWLQRGGIIAIAHVRGGGELGPAWHEGGRGANKENSIIDFINCAEFMVNNGYTRPSRLVISGNSAGGIVIGMAMTLRPELFAAAAIDVGILNTTRLDKIPIGPMNFDEFGSPATKQGMYNLRKIDAFGHLKDKIHYPAVMLTVGLNDDRVSPWQSAKFAARLDQIAQGVKKPNPVLVIAEKNAGHNPNTYVQADTKLLDMISFFLCQTGSCHVK